MHERRDLLLELDLQRVVDAIEAVDDHGDGIVGQSAFATLCRFAQIRHDPYAFQAKAKSVTEKRGSTTPVGLSIRPLLELIFSSYRPARVHAAYQALLLRRLEAAKIREASEAAERYALADALPASTSTLPQAHSIEGLERVFASCDRDGDGLVSFDDVRAALPHCPADYLAEMMMRHSPELTAQRASDLAEMRKISTRDLLARAHLPVDMLSKINISPPLTVANLLTKWSLLHAQVVPHLNALEAERLGMVAQQLKRHGAMSVAKLPWAAELGVQPPPFDLFMDVHRDVYGNPRAPPVTLENVRLSLNDFKKVFDVASNVARWGSFTADEGELGDARTGMLAGLLRSQRDPSLGPVLRLARPGRMLLDEAVGLSHLNCADDPASANSTELLDNAAGSNPQDRDDALLQQRRSSSASSGPPNNASSGPPNNASSGPPNNASSRPPNYTEEWRWGGTLIAEHRDSFVAETVGAAAPASAALRDSKHSRPQRPHTTEQRRLGLTSMSRRVTARSPTNFGELLQRHGQLRHWTIVNDSIDVVTVTPRPVDSLDAPNAAPRPPRPPHPPPNQQPIAVPMVKTAVITASPPPAVDEPKPRPRPRRRPNGLVMRRAKAAFTVSTTWRVVPEAER